MSWPTPQDYNEAVQAPQVSFSDKELAGGRATCDKLGLPRPVSGAFASVYHFECGPHDWAVRCFLHSIADQEKRYAELSNFVDHDDLQCTVPFTFMPDGIRIHGSWYPMLRMEWVHGTNLNTFVEKQLRDKRMLSKLADQFKAMCLDMDRAGIAHGDLQHGNIMVVADGSLRLVDYDGMFVPALLGWQSNELGHRNYQHPGRTKIHFGAYLDNFSAWVIYTSLKALAANPELWRTLHGGDECLLLRQADFQDPLASEAFAALESLDFTIVELSRRIRYYLTLPVEKVPGLDSDVVAPADLLALPSSEERDERREQRLNKKREQVVGASWMTGWHDLDGGVATQTKTQTQTSVVTGTQTVAHPLPPDQWLRQNNPGQYHPGSHQGAAGYTASSYTKPPAYKRYPVPNTFMKPFMFGLGMLMVFGWTIGQIASNHSPAQRSNKQMYQAMQIATSALMQKRYFDAIAEDNRILAVDADNPLALLNRSFCRRQLEQFDGAIADADAVMKVGYDPEAAFDRAAATVSKAAATLSSAAAGGSAVLSESMRSEVERAMTDLTQLIGQQRRPEYFFFRGHACELLGLFRNAEVDYETCLMNAPKAALDSMTEPIEPNAKGPTLADVHFRMGLTQAKMHDYVGALESFNMCLSLTEHPEARFDRALTYLKCNEPAKALADIQIYIEKNPGDQRGYALRRRIQAEMKPSGKQRYH